MTLKIELSPQLSVVPLRPESRHIGASVQRPLPIMLANIVSLFPCTPLPVCIYLLSLVLYLICKRLGAGAISVVCVYRP